MSLLTFRCIRDERKVPRDSLYLTPGPIFSKPLKSLPILVQTGYLDALTFCLSLRPSFVPFNNDLMRVLGEALAIAEVDDVAKVRQQRKLQLLTNSRVVAIELLSTAMSCAEFQAPEHQDFRNRIIGVFFKTLTLRSKASTFYRIDCMDCC